MLGLAAFAPSAARAQTQDLFVTNAFGNTVSRFAGTGPGTISSTPTTLAGGLSEPVDLTFDAHGNLFVTNTGANSIIEYTAGATPGTFGAVTTLTASSLKLPEGLAFDAFGNLYAANYTGNNASGSITEFVAGTAPGTFGAGQIVESGLTDPDGLAFDAHGDLFAATTLGVNGGSITEFAAGTTPGTFGPATALTDPNEPRGLAVDVYGDLFAANQGNNTITEFVAGATPGTFGATKTLTDPTLNAVEGLAFDVRGDLFAANLYSGSFGLGTITKFTAGTTPGTFGSGMVVASGLDSPDGLAFGPSVSAPVPEDSTTVSLGLLLALGMGGLVVAGRHKRKA